MNEMLQQFVLESRELAESALQGLELIEQSPDRPERSRRCCVLCTP